MSSGRALPARGLERGAAGLGGHLVHAARAVGWAPIRRGRGAGAAPVACVTMGLLVGSMGARTGRSLRGEGVAPLDICINVNSQECGDIFLGIKSLIDVAGGHGGAARAIAKAFPQVKCTVLDLPHVVAEAPTDGNVQFVSGDMFEYIPPANVLFLKWVFHDWGDDDCVKILRKCKEAIPPREAGGKVIIVDMVVGSGPNEIVTRETQVFFDLFIMFLEGIEREEFEWKKIFIEAGFSDYKIISVLGVRSVIELYP